MKAARRWTTLALCAVLLAAPFARARAAADDTGDQSRVGVLLMVMCGLAAKASLAAPVPWSGVAIVSCIAGLFEAAMTADSTGGGAAGHP